MRARPPVAARNALAPVSAAARVQVSRGSDPSSERIWLRGSSLRIPSRASRLPISVTAPGRMIPGLHEQDAFLYLPADVLLLRHARALAEERAHHLPEPATDDDEIEREHAPGAAESDYQALGSRASQSEVVFGSRVLGPAELERARFVAEECGLQLGDPVAFAFALREAAGPGGDNAVPLEAKRRALRTLLSRRVREYCARTGASHRDTYARFKGRAGRAVSRLNEAALSRHVRTVEGWLEGDQRRELSPGAARP